MQLSRKEKIIFDTDIGSDIDDSFALGYLLNKSDVDLIGVTCVSGQSYERALLSKIMIELASQNVPVYYGNDKPLGEQEELQPVCHMTNLLDKYEVKGSIEKENASDFLVRIVNEYPCEITLVSVAPFTNVAKALLTDKDFGKKLKRLVIMGGKVDQSKTLKKVLDWNILCDVKAGDIMLSSEFRELVIFPCDLTNTVFTPSSYLKENVSGVYEEVLNDMGNNWFERDHIVFHYHDPMAAVYCVKPELFKLTEGTMSIINDENGSYTVFDESGHKHHLAIGIDREAFLSELYNTISNKEN